MRARSIRGRLTNWSKHSIKWEILAAALIRCLDFKAIDPVAWISSRSKTAQPVSLTPASSAISVAPGRSRLIAGPSLGPALPTSDQAQARIHSPAGKHWKQLPSLCFDLPGPSYPIQPVRSIQPVRPVELPDTNLRSSKCHIAGKSSHRRPAPGPRSI